MEIKKIAIIDSIISKDLDFDKTDVCYIYDYQTSKFKITEEYTNNHYCNFIREYNKDIQLYHYYINDTYANDDVVAESVSMANSINCNIIYVDFQFLLFPPKLYNACIDAINNGHIVIMGSVDQFKQKELNNGIIQIEYGDDYNEDDKIYYKGSNIFRVHSPIKYKFKLNKDEWQTDRYIHTRAAKLCCFIKYICENVILIDDNDSRTDFPQSNYEKEIPDIKCPIIFITGINADYERFSVLTELVKTMESKEISHKYITDNKNKEDTFYKNDSIYNDIGCLLVDIYGEFIPVKNKKSFFDDISKTIADCVIVCINSIHEIGSVYIEIDKLRSFGIENIVILYSPMVKDHDNTAFDKHYIEECNSMISSNPIYFKDELKPNELGNIIINILS